ncbi:hypothetical protein HDR58_11115 [bacterium]|nr:hypothetical protein [bacterium]
MTSSKFKQLNPFELKSALTNLLAKINSVQDIQNCLADFDMLDAQEDKTILSKLLIKELVNAKVEKIPIICFLLEHYTQKDELINKLWEVLKNENLQSEVKITVINLLRELDADWSYETCEEYLGDSTDILDENTKQLLNTAIINPEVQIDFLDFLASIRVQDKITLLNSFGKDFSDDALANILIPVFVSEPNSPAGKEALKLLGETKSELALHTLESMQNTAKGELAQAIRRSLSTLKISGIREDNTKEFYKKILSNSTPDKFYITYPDGHGDTAMIFTRKTSENKIRFVSIVINIDTGIKDCFGFFEISQFECDKILERFLRDEKTVSIAPETFKTILHNAEMRTVERNNNDWKLPYEYVCWKNLLIDIDYDSETIEQILKEQLLPKKTDSTILEQLENMKISSHWFLDSNYSDEFEEMLIELKNSEDLDKLVNEFLPKVFYEEEKISWVKKLLFSTYLKFTIGKDEEASAIYGLAQDEDMINELFKNILQRSIYEYLTAIKYNKDLNTENFSAEEIDEKLKFIEEKWVKNV